MKIGILTFQRANNYGAMLQNYALKTVLERANPAWLVETIDYRCWEIEKNYEVHLLPRNALYRLSAIKSLFLNILNYRLEITRKYRFAVFRNKLNLGDEIIKQTLDKLQEMYDIVICGSDQVWNIEIIGEDNVDVYNLNIIDTLIKASYAASAGSASNLTKKMIVGIRNLCCVSVREQSLYEVLKKNGIKSKVVCDPVFLLQSYEWEALKEPLSSRQKSKYLFLYYIDSRRIEAMKIASSIRKKYRYKVVYPVPRTKDSIKYGGRCVYDASPQKFLSLLANAEIVVASSFHAVAFSIIFEKQFIVIPHEKTGSRVIDLLVKFDLQDRIVNSYEEYIRHEKELNTSINYSMIRQKINKWRYESLEYLMHVCMLGDIE
ncbi:polysaccharide pyruvyl transferase family protein [Eisenbergiella sp.]